MALVIGDWCDIEPMSYSLADAEDLQLLGSQAVEVLKTTNT